MSNLLVVDFDFFFPEPESDPDFMYDWGHKESPLFIEMLWNNRAAAFVSNGLDLPTTTGEEDYFWDRFKFSKDARLFVSESNAQAASPHITDFLSNCPDPLIRSVWLYDAHHDCGYQGPDMDVEKLLEDGRFSCENWMILYKALGAKLHVRYPSWKPWAMEAEPVPPIKVDRQVDVVGDNNPDDVVFDAVFLCRSGAWVPTWCDEQFFSFLHDAPMQSFMDLLADHYPLKTRPFDMKHVHEEIELWKTLRERTDA